MADRGFNEGKKLLCGDYTAYTPTGSSLFKKAGRWGNIPHVGDIVYFYTKRLGRISHVGAVISVKLSGITYTIGTAEGNTSSDSQKFEREGGCSAIHYYSFTKYQVGGTNRIAGFGTPCFGDDTCTKEEFLQALMNEIGYYEKETKAYLEEKTKNVGDKNYTKFGAWYHSIGHESYYVNGQWCQMFISYCAFQACRHHNESAPAGFTGWIHGQDNNGWYWVYRKDGKNVHGWQKINGRWWFFEASGKLKTGWLTDDDGQTYYIKESSGMIANDWLKENGYWYYFKPDGAMMVSEWIYWRDKWYYMSHDGKMATNTNIPAADGVGWYWVDANGVWDEAYRRYPKP